MDALERARRWLEHHHVGDLIERVRETEAHTASLVREVALAEGRVGWFDRVNLLTDSPEEQRVAEIRKEAEAAGKLAAEARRARDEVLATCKEDCPPIEVVYRAESILGAVLASPTIGRAADKSTVAADNLVALAETIEARWFEGLSWPDLLGRLVDSALQHDASASVGLDPLLGWAPVTVDQLARSAAARLASGAAERARARRGLEAERARLEQELRAREAQVGFFDEIMPGASADERARDDAAKRLAEGTQALVSSIEAAHHAVAEALAAAHPMLAIAIRCRATAGVLRAIGPRDEYVIGPGGQRVAVPSPYLRCVALAGLLALRRATDHAFQGLGPQMFPRSSDDRDTGDPGPYRARASGARARAVVVKGTTASSRAVFAALEGSPLRAELDGALAHATLLGLIEPSRSDLEARIGWLERLEAWSDGPHEAEVARLGQRLKWHRELAGMRASQALELVGQYAMSDPRHRLGQALVVAHGWLDAVTTPGGRSSSPRSCPVINHDAAISSMQHALRTLTDGFGGIADRDWLIQQICLRIERSNGPIRSRAPEAGESLSENEVVDRLAAALQPTDFVRLVREIEARRPAESQARQHASAMDQQVSFFDRLNVFTDSPTERARDEAKSAADAHGAAIAQMAPQLEALLRHAVALHPPTYAAQFGVGVLSATRAIHAVSVRRTTTTGSGKHRRTKTYYVCQLRGKQAATDALARWSAHLYERVGPFSSVGDFMEEWIASELR